MGAEQLQGYRSSVVAVFVVTLPGGEELGPIDLFLS
jgi:hypothetical protein